MSPELRPIRSSRPARGLSLVEMLVALAISSVLLTATAVAIDTSFKSYAIAAESASTQTATRMVVNRVLTMIRTSTAHGPVSVSEAIAGQTVTSAGGRLLESSYLELIPPNAPANRLYRLLYDAPNQRIMLAEIDFSGTVENVISYQPIIGGVSRCKFQILPRRDNYDNIVLERASLDMIVEADDDATLDLEAGNVPPVRVIASTKPRRVVD